MQFPVYLVVARPGELGDFFCQIFVYGFGVDEVISNFIRIILQGDKILYIDSGFLANCVPRFIPVTFSNHVFDCNINKTVHVSLPIALKVRRFWPLSFGTRNFQC